MQTEIKRYIAELNRLYKAGNATEHSYRPALQNLLSVLISSLQVTNEPKRIACGAPDFIVTRGAVPVGYIEAKDIGADLYGKANKAQFDRYRQSLDNLMITDYLTFILYFRGETCLKVTIGELTDKGIIFLSAELEKFEQLIHFFSQFQGAGIPSAAILSKVMASKARLMANIIENALNDDEICRDAACHVSTITGQLNGFREILIQNITIREFSDIYAQTIAYGMFAAILNEAGTETSSFLGRAGEGLFTRNIAAQLIPHSNPFLRKLFQYIAGYDLDERIQWVVDDLADLFNHVDISTIIKEFGKLEHDPIIHFYETFLSEYDPALRKSRGVWYTPQPVVNFIVRAVDDILKQDFSLSQGLADASKVKLPRQVRQSDGSTKNEDVAFHRVQILDPATGTGTFLAEVVQNIYSKFKSQQGMWQAYASQHLIPRVNGFEILMASYAMAHLKIDMLLKQTGYRHTGDERLRIFLTNSLSEAHKVPVAHFAQWLFDEASQASHIKQDVPVMVVLGNPPYSGESQNSGKWMNNLMNDYKKEPSGIKLQEKNAKWINDDYVKFIRFAQYFINKNGEGILAFINNHSFLDNPTFRGMRFHLLKTFDKIYILDLHGNAKKKETAPDGSKDENVFDIQQGVSINIFVKSSRDVACRVSTTLAEVYHADLFGKRAEKYSFLLNNTLQSVQWRKLELTAPQYFFVAKDFSLQEEYDNGFSVQELFPVSSVGIVTAKDEVFVNTDKKMLLKNIRESLNINPNETLIQNIDYRPFDNRFIYYDAKRIERARENVIQHFLIGENIGLIASRQCVNDWKHVFISKKIANLNLTGTAGRFGSGYVFPLYVYIKNGITDEDKSPYHKKPNLNKTIINELSQRLKLQFTEEKETPPLEGAGGGSFAPIDVFDYIYAVLHSRAYRERYKEFLKIDFPRVPYPKDAAHFWFYAHSGSKLRRLHLMDGVEPQEGIADFPVAGSNEIESIRFTPTLLEGAGGRLYINNTQYFDHVPSETWNFYIGGYQPAQKWLKDRKGRKLVYEDIVHYQKIIVVLKETGELMRIVDEVKM